MRRPNDFYETNRLAVHELLKFLPSELGTVFEPTAGLDAISRVLVSSGRCAHLITNDIDPKFNHPNHFDARLRSHWKDLGRIDWTITNPPFGDAYQILENALEFSKLGVALLLRLSFLEPTKEREDLLHLDPPYQIIVLPRYSFTGDGKTDTVTCAWMIWQNISIHPGTIRVSKRFK